MFFSNGSRWMPVKPKRKIMLFYSVECSVKLDRPQSLTQSEHINTNTPKGNTQSAAEDTERL